MLVITVQEQRTTVPDQRVRDEPLVSERPPQSQASLVEGDRLVAVSSRSGEIGERRRGTRCGQLVAHPLGELGALLGQLAGPLGLAADACEPRELS